MHGTNDNKTYYLQYVRDNGDIFKVGDFVYLKSENELHYIARIDKIHKVPFFLFLNILYRYKKD